MHLALGRGTGRAGYTHDPKTTAGHAHLTSTSRTIEKMGDYRPCRRSGPARCTPPRPPRAPAFVDPPGYASHRPETTLLYQLVEQHYPVFRELRGVAGRLQLQEARALPLLWRAPHGRDRRAAGRRDTARASAAPVGAVTADGAALPSGHPSRRALGRARRGVSNDLWPSDERGSPGPPHRAQRRGHADPALRLGVEAERAAAHDLRPRPTCRPWSGASPNASAGCWRGAG